MTWYYRYCNGQQEIVELGNHRKIEDPSNNRTWFGAERYISENGAKKKLSLKFTPEYRIGAIPENEMPQFQLGPRRARPKYGNPGGGVEVAVDEPVWLFGLWDYTNDDWEGL